MKKRLAICTLLLGSAVAFAQPAAARDRDDHWGDRGRGSYARVDNRRGSDHEREEWREHERWEHRSRPYVNNYGYGYNSGYGYNGGYGYDYNPGYGYGNYSNGYYDQFGNWCQR